MMRVSLTPPDNRIPTSESYLRMTLSAILAITSFDHRKDKASQATCGEAHIHQADKSFWRDNMSIVTARTKTVPRMIPSQ